MTANTAKARRGMTIICRRAISVLTRRAFYYSIIMYTSAARAYARVRRV